MEIVVIFIFVVAIICFSGYILPPGTASRNLSNTGLSIIWSPGLSAFIYNPQERNAENAKRFWMSKDGKTWTKLC